MVGLGVDYRAYRLRPRRTIVQDLHGPFTLSGPAWPTPYRFPIESEAQLADLSKPVGGDVVALWCHGQLVQVVNESILEGLRDMWGKERTEAASVGAVPIPDLSAEDRDLMGAFCARGWQRLLVRAFEHVGCKLHHYERSQSDVLAPFGDLADALLACRERHRLAALEELIRAHGGDAKRLFARLDRMDRALDAASSESGWMAAQVPEHVQTLWPMRNLLRLADRVGVLFQEQQWKDYEAANTYAPELRVLSVEPEIYGAGVEHDITHYLETVFWSPERVPFEVGNNGSEGDGQAMNNLILACHHEGPAYEGYAGWPGAQLFEWLERAFQVASIPQLFCVLRTFTIVLHREFTGDKRSVLQELVPDLVDGKHLDDLLRFYPGYVQHDHDFLGQMHPRYLSPMFDEWRALFGEAITDSLEEHVAYCDKMLWSLEDLDLRGHDHPLLGDITNCREVNRLSGKKALELRHLLRLGPKEASTILEDSLTKLIARVVAADKGLSMLAERALRLYSSRPGPRRSNMGSQLALELGPLRTMVVELSRRLGDDLARIRSAQSQWPDPIVAIPEEFLKPDCELFRGYYYEPAIHVGSDSMPGPKRLGEYESVA